LIYDEMCRGEFLDVSPSSARDHAWESYSRVITHKTAALFRFVCGEAARMDVHRKDFNAYAVGDALGRLFQIANDCFDYDFLGNCLKRHLSGRPTLNLWLALIAESQDRLLCDLMGPGGAMRYDNLSSIVSELVNNSKIRRAAVERLSEAQRAVFEALTDAPPLWKTTVSAFARWVSTPASWSYSKSPFHLTVPIDMNLRTAD